MKIPTPIPVLKIPATTAQLENVVSIEISKAIVKVCFFMFYFFYNNYELPVIFVINKKSYCKVKLAQ